MEFWQEWRYLIAAGDIERLTLEEIRAELEWLVEQRFKWSHLDLQSEERYRLLADRERCLLEAS